MSCPFTCSPPLTQSRSQAFSFYRLTPPHSRAHQPRNAERGGGGRGEPGMRRKERRRSITQRKRRHCMSANQPSRIRERQPERQRNTQDLACPRAEKERTRERESHACTESDFECALWTNTCGDTSRLPGCAVGAVMPACVFQHVLYPTQALYRLCHYDCMAALSLINLTLNFDGVIVQ